MFEWSTLNRLQKFFFIVLAIFAVWTTSFFAIPELLIIADIGGIEVIASFILLNVIAIRHWIHSKINTFRKKLLLCTVVLQNSCLSRQSFFFTCALVAGFALIASGSLIYSISLFLTPGLLLESIPLEWTLYL